MELIDRKSILKKIEECAGRGADDLWSMGYDDACDEIYDIVENEPAVLDIDENCMTCLNDGSDYMMRLLNQRSPKDAAQDGIA